MPAYDRPPRPGSARERIAARRAARSRGGWPAVRLALAAAALLALAAIGSVLLRANATLGAIQQADPRRQADAPAPGAQNDRAGGAAPNALTEPINILLIGVDKRPDLEEGVRSDTLILVHLDPQARWASMLSIPRDSVVTIPRFGQSKINAAYTSGYANAEQIYGAGTDPDAAGGALAAETVENFLGVSVDYVAQVDFQGFAQLVDAVGGVLVDVERPLLDAEFPTDDYGVERVFIPAGLQVMDGRTALTYARSRHSSSDFNRSQRQQQVLRALLAQVKARGLLENASALPSWADVLAQNVRTTLPLRDLGMINGLAELARDLDAERIVQLSISPNDVAIDSEAGSDIYWNKADLAALVARWQAGPQAASVAETARVQVLNGAGVDGIAGRVSGMLQSRGFVLAEAQTAAQPYQHTLIIDYTGRPQTRQRLADELGVDPRFVQATPGPNAPPPAYQVDIVVIVGQDYQPWWVEN